MRKIEIPTDTPTEFELGDTDDIQRREERGVREEKKNFWGVKQMKWGKE